MFYAVIFLALLGASPLEAAGPSKAGAEATATVTVTVTALASENGQPCHPCPRKHGQTACGGGLFLAAQTLRQDAALRPPKRCRGAIRERDAFWAGLSSAPEPPPPKS